MIEKKDSLTSKKYNYFFDKPLEIEVTKDGFDMAMEIKELGIKTDSIAKLVELFEKAHAHLSTALQYTDEELAKKRFLDKLGIEREAVKAAKKKINSKAKGNRGELNTIKELGPHFPGLAIHRCPGSGAIATIHNITNLPKDSLDLTGDLFAVPDDSEEYQRFQRFCFENKSYGTLPDRKSVV